jgi:hypothetical protein
MKEKLLRIYLQDHLAGSTAGLELARRTRAANEGTEYGPPLAKIADEIDADRRQLQGIMEELGFGGDRAKNIAAWGLEKAGRLKLNGQLTGYSPQEERLDAALLERLRERAEAQRATVEELRERAAREAFS